MKSILVAMVLLMGACQHIVKFESEPSGAQIFVGKNKIGKTPIAVKLKTLEQSESDPQMVEILMRKQGFEDVRVYLYKGTFSNFQFNVRMPERVVAEPQTVGEFVLTSEQQTQLNAFLATGMHVHQLIVAGQYTEAEEVLNELKEKFPKIATVYTLLGNLRANQGRDADALAYYKRALALDRENAFLQTTVLRLTRTASGGFQED